VIIVCVLVMWRIGGDAISARSDGEFAWGLWREYRGCLPVPNARYIGEINFSRRGR